MFSQLRNAVESLATPVPPRTGSPVPHNPQGDDAARHAHGDPNLRKVMVSQRAASPGPSSSSRPPRSASPSPSVLRNIEPAKGRKMNLEERLRAKFVIGEASNSTTPDASKGPSPSPDSTPTPGAVPDRVASPASVPLPESPVVTAAALAEGPSDPLEPLSPNDSHQHITSPLSESLQASTEIVSPTPRSPAAMPSLLPQTVEEPTDTADSQEYLPPEEHDDDNQETTPESPRVDSTSPEPEVPSPRDPSPVKDTLSPDKDTASPEADAVPPDSEDHSSSEPSDPTELSTSTNPDVENLQKRLKLVEQRFAEVSTSFKRLQAERQAVDAIVREFELPFESMRDGKDFRDFLQNMTMKAEISQDEIRRLTGRLSRQEERIEELRDTHRLESSSQSQLIQQLRQQIEELEALLRASEESASKDTGKAAEQEGEISRLKAELQKATATAKEEQEKCAKAVTLLKTVRQKLVKTEKERDDATKELASFKEQLGEEQDKEKAERTRLQHEIENAHAEKEKAVVGLRTQFDKEVSLLKDRSEKEMLAFKTQVESDTANLKNAFSKDLAVKESQVSALEQSVQSLSNEKSELFDQLQLRQAELESSQLQMDSLQGQNNELQYQLRECNDRVALLAEELSDARQGFYDRSPGVNDSALNLDSMLSAVEAKYEMRLSDLQKRFDTAEKERSEAEADWSRKLSDKSKEVDNLKKALSSNDKSKGFENEKLSTLMHENEKLLATIREQRTQILALEQRTESFTEVEDAAKMQVLQAQTKLTTLEQQISELKNREIQLKANNKTLREELRKVQSSAALLERQRNPGVGYWSTRQENGSSAAPSRTSMSSVTSDPPSRPGSPRPQSPANNKNDEEVNLEYLRNVILQFLEHKEMRPNLVRVLSIILHFTPQETRRLIAKV